MTAPPPTNTYPYAQNYFLSLERQLTADTVLSFSYVGSEAHHLLVIYSANPGNPALCLSLSQASAVAPGTPICGAFQENTQFTQAPVTSPPLLPRLQCPLYGTPPPLWSPFP